MAMREFSFPNGQNYLYFVPIADNPLFHIWSPVSQLDSSHQTVLLESYIHNPSVYFYTYLLSYGSFSGQTKEYQGYSGGGFLLSPNVNKHYYDDHMYKLLTRSVGSAQLNYNYGWSAKLDYTHLGERRNIGAPLSSFALYDSARTISLNYAEPTFPSLILGYDCVDMSVKLNYTYNAPTVLNYDYSVCRTVDTQALISWGMEPKKLIYEYSQMHIVGSKKLVYRRYTFSKVEKTLTYNCRGFSKTKTLTYWFYKTQKFTTRSASYFAEGSSIDALAIRIIRENF